MASGCEIERELAEHGVQIYNSGQYHSQRFGGHAHVLASISVRFLSERRTRPTACSSTGPYRIAKVNVCPAVVTGPGVPANVTCPSVPADVTGPGIPGDVTALPTPCASTRGLLSLHAGVFS